MVSHSFTQKQARLYQIKSKQRPLYNHFATLTYDNQNKPVHLRLKMKWELIYKLMIADQIHMV